VRATNQRRATTPQVLLQRLVLLVAAIFLAGCSVKLVPSYDRTIVEGLTEANRETLELFAAVSNGAPGETFGEREPKYNELIGAFDALRLQADARPVPRPLVLQWFGLGTPDGKQPEEIEKLQNPTPGILEEVRETLIRMRETDRGGRLSATLVTGFKNSYELSIDQALTVEKALER